jgi:hypothetical protein
MKNPEGHANTPKPALDRTTGVAAAFFIGGDIRGSAVFRQSHESQKRFKFRNCDIWPSTLGCVLLCDFSRK